MVFFTCSHCGESVKKAAVAKHYQTKCMNHTPFVTCVDCLKDFKGNDYEAHIKCFTEEEKYSAKGFVPKASANKGERKQKAWSECIQVFASNGDLEEDEKELLDAISKHDNIPRKKIKFMNFLNSTARSFINKTELVDRVWTKIENYFKEVNSESQKNAEMNDGNEKGETGGNENQKKKRKQDKITGNDEKNNDGEKPKKKKKKNHSGEQPQNGEDAENKGKKKKRPSENEGGEVNGNEEPKSKKAKKSKENVNDKENMSQKQKGAEKEKSTEEENADDENEAEDTFDWNDTIMKIVTKGGAKNPIKMNKLQKKVLKIYGEAKGCEINDKMAKKFAKKLGKMEMITVNGDYVTLKS